jgi:hypothetical protein
MRLGKTILGLIGWLLLCFAAAAVGYQLPETIIWSNVPLVAIALTTVITLAPASLMAYAGLLSTPLAIARGAFGMSLLMSVYDILTTMLGYDVFERMMEATKVDGGMTADTFLTWAGVFMTSVLASFADEAAIVFFTLSMIYFHESWKRWRGEDFEFLRTQVNTQTISGLERILGLDGRISGESGGASRSGNR